MALSIDWGLKLITVPLADLTLESGILYVHDVNAFRLELKALEASEGISHQDTHLHNTEVTIAGVTYIRGFQIINGYQVQYEDSTVIVRLEGANNNIFDQGILVRNQVIVVPTNSAGLQVVSTGSGVTEQDKTDIASSVWTYTRP